MNYNLWPSNITVLDDFVQDKELYTKLKDESVITQTVQGQNAKGLSESQLIIKEMTTHAVINYCNETGIEYNCLSFTNLQKGFLYQYDESMVNNHLYEPHHDIAEQSYITAIYYIDSIYEENKWCGGELTIYKHLSFVDYPQNIINILPKQNRLIIFPGFLTHRVKPYFGSKPRSSLVFGWSVKEPQEANIITL